jgi:hypothetical protein
MPVYNVGGKSVTVKPRTVNLFFTCRQGIHIAVSSQVSAISGSITLEGVAPTAQASGSCSNCDKLNIMGPRAFGIGVKPTYQRVSYNLTINVGQQNFEISDTLLYN